jgi:1-acyl-sn-glycerol-3-phosphate acyltransferase
MPPTMSRRSDPPPPDPVKTRSPLLCRLFSTIMTREIARHFRALRLAKPGVPDLPSGRPVMICSNHPSWWDPAVFIAVHHRLFPGREGYGPMDAAELERYGFMRRIGVFGVRQDARRGAADFLRPAMAITSLPHTILWVTAQGRFADPRNRPLALRRGAAALMGRSPDLMVLPLALEYPFWTEKRPEALMMFGRPIETGAPDPERVLEEALTSTMDDLARLSTAGEASAFLRIIDGSRGPGGLYAGWKRAGAALKGQRYVADHREERK